MLYLRKTECAIYITNRVPYGSIETHMLHKMDFHVNLYENKYSDNISTKKILPKIYCGLR